MPLTSFLSPLPEGPSAVSQLSGYQAHCQGKARAPREGHDGETSGGAGVKAPGVSEQTALAPSHQLCASGQGPTVPEPHSTCL